MLDGIKTFDRIKPDNVQPRNSESRDEQKKSSGKISKALKPKNNMAEYGW